MRKSRIKAKAAPLVAPSEQLCYAYGLIIAFAMWAALSAAVTLF